MNFVAQHQRTEDWKPFRKVMVQFRRNSYDSSAVKKTIAALLEANCPAQGYPRHLSEAGGPDTAIIVTLHQPHASHCPGLVSRWAMAATRTPQDLSPAWVTFCKLEQPTNITQYYPTLPASFVFRAQTFVTLIYEGNRHIIISFIWLPNCYRKVRIILAWPLETRAGTQCWAARWVGLQSEITSPDPAADGNCHQSGEPRR